MRICIHGKDPRKCLECPDADLQRKHMIESGYGLPADLEFLGDDYGDEKSERK